MNYRQAKKKNKKKYCAELRSMVDKQLVQFDIRKYMKPVSDETGRLFIDLTEAAQEMKRRILEAIAELQSIADTTKRRSEEYGRKG